jgi:hypothetical protein
MNQVEQALFTSAQTPRGDGYQLVAHSPGLRPEDERELTAWGPSHDSLRDPNPGAVSYNAFRLPSGAYCVSRTVPDGQEYSRRGGFKVLTHYLIVPPAIMDRFGNSALGVIRVAIADGVLDHVSERVHHLPSVTLTGKASVVDRTALDRVRSRLGPDLLAALVEKILGESSVSIVGGPPAESLIAAVLSCFPPECRCEFSFSTGLRFSRRRPFRIIFAPEDPKELKQFIRQSGCVPFDLTCPSEFTPALEHGWALFLHEVLLREKPGTLSAQFAHPRTGLTLRGLDQLGRDLLADANVWQSYVSPEHHDDEPEVIPFVPAAASLSATPPSPIAASDERGAEPVAATLTRAHAAHTRFEHTRRAAVAPTLDALPPTSAVAEAIALDPALQERLEHLDDIVFDAIDGKSEALEELKTLWPQLTRQLAAAAIDESREQYLRRALDVWNQTNPPGESRDAARATAALDVLCVLIG